jgi:hypothetical protein
MTEDRERVDNAKAARHPGVGRQKKLSEALRQNLIRRKAGKHSERRPEGRGFEGERNDA